MHRDSTQPPALRRLGAVPRLPLAALLTLIFACAGCGEGDGGNARDTATSEADEIAYAVSHVLIRVEKDRPGTTAEALIRQAHRALEAGASFADVARGRSKGPAAADGGFLGFVEANADTAFSGAVQSLRPGQVTPPIRTGLGWHIIKRHSFEEARTLEQRYRIPTQGVFIAWDNPERPGARKPTGRTKAQAHTIALEVRNKLASGELTLDQAMEQFTHPQDRRPGAYLRPTTNREGSHAMFDALKDVKAGAIVGPLDLPRGFAVLVRGRYLRSLFRHILVQHVGSKERALSIARTPQAALALAQEALDAALADRSQWDSLVARYSDDRFSRPLGGRMGILHSGHMPEGFETFAYTQPPGSIHPEVVATPHGFHVVWKIN